MLTLARSSLRQRRLFPAINYIARYMLIQLLETRKRGQGRVLMFTSTESSAHVGSYIIFVTRISHAQDNEALARPLATHQFTRRLSWASFLTTKHYAGSRLALAV